MSTFPCDGNQNSKVHLPMKLFTRYTNATRYNTQVKCKRITWLSNRSCHMKHVSCDADFIRETIRIFLERITWPAQLIWLQVKIVEKSKSDDLFDHRGLATGRNKTTPDFANKQKTRPKVDCGGGFKATVKPRDLMTKWSSVHVKSQRSQRPPIVSFSSSIHTSGWDSPTGTQGNKSIKFTLNSR